MRLNGNYTYVGGNGGSASGSWAFDHVDTGSTFKSILFGYANSGGNAAEIGFNYVGSSSGSNYVNIGFYGSRPLTVTYSGYVGIGMTNPNRHFHMIGEASFTSLYSSMYFNLCDSAGNNGGNYTAVFRGLGSSGSAQVNMAGFSVLASSSYFSGNLQVDGNVGIGITSSRKLLVYESTGTVAGGSGQGTVVIRHGNNGGSSSIVFPSAINYDGADYGYIQYNDNRTSGGENATFIIGIQNDADDNIALLASGNIGIQRSDPAYALDVSGSIRATGDVIAYSDARFKTDLEPIGDALNKVSRITGYTFMRIDEDEKEKEKGRRHAGVIAQEVLEILPEVVYMDKTEKYNVAYGNLTALLIQAIKEERQKREAVTCELRSLEERLAKLEKLLEQK
jgi:hypothetical protein